MRSEKLEQYKRLKAEHGDSVPNLWYAEQLGVNPGTITRWNQKLQYGDDKARIKAEIYAEIKAEILSDIKTQRELEEQAKREAGEERGRQIEQMLTDRRAYFRRLLAESGTETLTTERDYDITWQGYLYHIPAGVPTEVPGIIAGQYRECLKGERERDKIIGYYRRG